MRRSERKVHCHRIVKFHIREREHVARFHSRRDWFDRLAHCARTDRAWARGLGAGAIGRLGGETPRAAAPRPLPATSPRPSAGPRGFRSSTPSFMRPAISRPRWARSTPACSTRYCPRSPRSRKSRASSIPAAAGCSARPATMSRRRRRRFAPSLLSRGWSRSSRAFSDRAKSTASSFTRRWSTRPTAASFAASPAMRSSAMRSAWWGARRCAGRSCTAKILRAFMPLRSSMRRRDRAISALGSMGLRSAASRAPSPGVFARRHQEPEIISADAIAAELGEWARGYALDQRLSGAKARRDLGWTPTHLDPEREIARLP